ncbi:transcriptional regulator [candidate division WOR-1 bacterium RIFOXYD2_FULL_36_8]|uniref:Probable transcriptional regulatory protein A2290_04600 n=1 Tax=candidate division WOR-1 bacterium RIFOXYB2_FULL_36_35 TaxID=1802578 RepID=A0A1F4S7E6_UNCSA|nr:MAG: transcriptional regulator [candidate division WOR-1 bacterium RIFOXYA2_FULL_36_21]OGC16109.1 MAG: transcriptional regulator [candidate division WOR-1 bacterium RIFOXYA12_FULL_36_13]OGC16356.1 MAG: transcriptional regulator [candidate division WOR-1 bacterium RIFOXYB2_FULL_36_35]OGC38846.1 MAG: transcriptional regulator [candidate division WOR-1 bacterium RIFOXYD2_FULL_36_8]
MSGHSKWATIKRAKAKTDAARGKVFTKIIRELTTAAKVGGPDPSGNPRLRLVIDKAKAANMPNDNIKRAIDRAAGPDAAVMEEITYEGYGPAGVAILIECMTDNKNRTLGDVRTVFSKVGGNLGSAGCVSYIFKRLGTISFDKSKVDADTLSMEAIDAGAEDIKLDDSSIEVITSQEKFEQIRDSLKLKGYEPENAEVTMIPSTTVALSGDDARKAMNLVEKLEELDDVQAVHSNFDIPDELMK